MFSNLNRSTVLEHYPNGYGKTIVLKMLNGIFNSRYTELLKIPYKSFQVMFEDDSYLEVLKGSLSDAKQQKPSLVLNFNNRPNGQENKSLNLEFDHHDLGKLSSSMLEEFIPGLYRTSPREWVYGRCLSRC
jgi:predicted ATP-binding protein involved in virulence